MTQKPSVAETVEFYSRPEVVGTFEEDRYSTSRGKVRWILQNEMFKRLTEGTADPILEVAAGTGRFSRQLAANGRELTVLDSSPTMLEKNRSHPQMAGKNVKYINALADKIPFETNSFGTLFCVDMFSHIKDARPILAEMSRVVRPGGHLIFNCTNRYSLMGLGASCISNPLRKLFGKLEVYSNYHSFSRVFKALEENNMKRVVTTGLFFIDPRLYRFSFGEKTAQRIIAMENWMSSLFFPSPVRADLD